MSSSDKQPILTITTSKNWVLPPRPKNVRKGKPVEKKKVKKSPRAQTPSPVANKLKSPEGRKEKAQPTSRPSPSVSAKPTASALASPEQLSTSIKLISRENYQLKTKLLSLIHDYKSLKSLVTSPGAAKAPPVDTLYDTTSTARKRVYQEMGDSMGDHMVDPMGDAMGDLGDPMNDLISDMSGLSHTSPHSVVSPVDQEMDQSGFEMELFNFINLEQDSMDDLGEGFEAEIHDEDEDDEADSASLSRLSSPTSDSDENSLMTTLTRSTTVSTTNSVIEKKPFSQPFKFHGLPEFSEEDYAFSFEKHASSDKKMSVIEEDQYNQVADFLEEKLMSNDVQYYVEKST